jgi:hypothetical protein
MDPKTEAALRQVAKEVDAGATPSGEAKMPRNVDHEALEQTLKNVQKEQASNPEKYKPALQEAPQESVPESAKEEEIPDSIKEEAEAMQKAINEASEPVICQKCGWDHNNVSIKPTDEEVNEFVRSAMGERGFEKEYSVWNGNLKITFGERSSTAKDEITQLLKTVRPVNPGRASIEVLTDIRKVQTMFALRRVQGPDFDKEFNIEVSHEDCAQALETFETEIGQQFKAIIVDVILRSFVEFDRLLIVLTEAAFDENFWEGAGLESP